MKKLAEANPIFRLLCTNCGFVVTSRSHRCEMKVPSFEQGSIDWHAWRLGGIGSSDAPAVMDATPFSNPLKLWEILTGRRKAFEPGTPAMRRGIELEPKARRVYEATTGSLMPKSLAIHPEMPFIRASLDGINRLEKKVLEIKCPGKEDHATARKGQIPKKYLWQLVHLLLVTGLPRLDYFSFDGEDGVIVPFTRDKKLEEELVSKEKAFWQHVQDDTPPPVKELARVDGIFQIKRR